MLLDTQAETVLVKSLAHRFTHTPQASHSFTDTKPVAKAPPLRRWPAFKRWAKRNRLAQWFSMAVLAALLWVYFSAMVRRVQGPLRTSDPSNELFFMAVLRGLDVQFSVGFCQVRA